MTQKNRQAQLFTGDVEFDGDVQIDGALTVAGAFSITGDITLGSGGTINTGSIIGAGSTLTLAAATHAGRLVGFDTATGSIVDLPNATGSGVVFTLIVTTTATSNSHILRVAASTDDLMVGGIVQADTDTSDATLRHAALVGDAFDTITFNRTTTGLAAVGDWLQAIDIGTGVWAIRGESNASGMVATPFSSDITS